MIFAVARRAELHQIRNRLVRFVLVQMMNLEARMRRAAQQTLLVPLENLLLQCQKCASVRIRRPFRRPEFVVAVHAAKLGAIRPGHGLPTLKALALHLAVLQWVIRLVPLVAHSVAEHPYTTAVPILRLLMLRRAALKALSTAVAFERYGRLCPRLGITLPARGSVRSLPASTNRTNAVAHLQRCSSRC